MIAVAKTTMSVFRRVKKSDVVVVAPAKTDPVSICLECWKSWLEKDDRDLKAKGMNLDAGADDDEKQRVAYESNPYDEQLKADCKIGEATDAMIDSLSAAQRWAIHRKCGVTTVWRFPNLDFIAIAAEAMVDLEKKLRGNVATGHLFD